MRRKGRNDHPPEVKAAVTAALLAGQGVMDVAREYNLPQQVVSSWKKRMVKNGAKKGDVLDALIFDYLRANLGALEAQARVASSDGYISKQPANELAILHGVMADKAVRILEAHEAAFGASELAAAPDAA